MPPRCSIALAASVMRGLSGWFWWRCLRIVGQFAARKRSPSRADSLMACSMSWMASSRVACDSRLSWIVARVFSYFVCVIAAAESTSERMTPSPMIPRRSFPCDDWKGTGV